MLLFWQTNSSEIFLLENNALEYSLVSSVKILRFDCFFQYCYFLQQSMQLKTTLENMPVGTPLCNFDCYIEIGPNKWATCIRKWFIFKNIIQTWSVNDKNKLIVEACDSVTKKWFARFMGKNTDLFLQHRLWILLQNQRSTQPIWQDFLFTCLIQLQKNMDISVSTNYRTLLGHHHWTNGSIALFTDVMSYTITNVEWVLIILVITPNPLTTNYVSWKFTVSLQWSRRLVTICYFNYWNKYRTSSELEIMLLFPQKMIFFFKLLVNFMVTCRL